MSIKIKPLQDEVKRLRIELHNSEIARGALLIESSRFKPLFKFWGKEYGWRKSETIAN